MEINQIVKNLQSTIVGKEFLLKRMENSEPSNDPVDRLVSEVTQKFLRINIDELKRILNDLAPKQDYWIIRKTPNTKDEYYVESGNPPQHVKEVYGIQ